MKSSTLSDSILLRVPTLLRSGCVLLCLLLFLLPAACRQSDPPPLQRTELLMGTVVEITLLQSGPKAEAALRDAFAEMRRIEQLMSPQLPTSDLARLAAVPRGAEVSAETLALLRRSIELNHLSGGAFDPTLGRVKRLWDIEGDKPHVATAAELRKALRQCGVDKLRIEGNRVIKLAPKLEIDFGGIAKGYAVDRAGAVLRRAGIRHASINAGGDLLLIGDRRGRPWRIGVQDPRKPGAVLAVIAAADEAVVTSGDYERFFEVDGVRYHHLFDPATGRPSRRSRSVTVVASDAATADALATAAFILGPEAGSRLLRQQGVEGILIGADGTPLVTPGLKDRVTWR
ncbi:hypothetical protein C2E25_00850 [Geothermobacter hydrogeniphilus]|uniref:FAD:protein FMN transferase n=1 Tax=Geothermobacter hydrogeniphilus TaxID=1969733 RepID=A0A2K2HEW3_9BACT|nr:FAD:protein FMN transferase [Geothermobacter hydrogeniphilus]PNU21809.1 hypothetical protein C2E25_00850 [Geothermobacter hydrogeniphilus]